MTDYDNANIFAKILRGEIPCFKVHEDDHTLAFMDIMPRADGHTLIIPKEAARNLLDASPALLHTLIAATQRVAKAAHQVFQSDGVMIAQFSEAAAGQTVFHLHFHVIPRYEGMAMQPEGTQGDMALIEQHAAKLRAALAR